MPCSCHTMPYHAMPYLFPHTMPYQTIPCHAMPYQAMPYHVRLYHVMSYNVIPPEHLSAPCPLLLLIQSVLQTAFQHELIRFLAQHLRWLTSTHCPGSGKRFTLYTLYASSVVDSSSDRNYDKLVRCLVFEEEKNLKVFFLIMVWLFGLLLWYVYVWWYTCYHCTVTQKRGPGGQFRFWPYSSFLSIYKGSVRLGYDNTVPQNRDPGGQFRFWPYFSFLSI